MMKTRITVSFFAFALACSRLAMAQPTSEEIDEIIFRLIESAPAALGAAENSEQAQRRYRGYGTYSAQANYYATLTADFVHDADVEKIVFSSAGSLERNLDEVSAYLGAAMQTSNITRNMTIYASQYEHHRWQSYQVAVSAQQAVGRYNNDVWALMMLLRQHPEKLSEVRAAYRFWFIF